jgi:hypothetical protein
MKTKFILFLLIVFYIFILQSCYAPKNILKLQPEEKDTGKWLYGQQFIADSLNGIIYEVGFERCQSEQYWFNFTITNHSNLPILIDPMLFKLQALNGYHKLIKESSALNPEGEILNIEKSLAKANSSEADAFHAYDLKTLKDSWENSTIRKTTLEPNYNIQGKVFFPAEREAVYIKLCLPVDTDVVELNFMQLQFPVK